MDREFSEIELSPSKSAKTEALNKRREDTGGSPGTSSLMDSTCPPLSSTGIEVETKFSQLFDEKESEIEELRRRLKIKDEHAKCLAEHLGKALEDKDQLSRECKDLGTRRQEIASKYKNLLGAYSSLLKQAEEKGISTTFDPQIMTDTAVQVESSKLSDKYPSLALLFDVAASQQYE